SGVCFSAIFLGVFMVTERIHHRRMRGEKHEHKEQFNRAEVEEISDDTLGLKKPYRKLVAIRSPHNLFMLEKALADTDPQTTEVVVMTAKLEPPGGAARAEEIDLDTYDRQLMTAVVNRAEKLGKRVMPLIVPTNNPLSAVLSTAKDIGAQEVMLGASNKYSAEEQLDQIALYWISLNDGPPQGLTVHIVSADRDVSFDLEGGNRIPKAAERQARSAAELRAAGIGVRRVLMAHDGAQTSRDVFEWLLTMLAPDVDLDLVAVAPHSPLPVNGQTGLEKDEQRAVQLGRKLKILDSHPQGGVDIVRLARDGHYNVIVIPWSEEVRLHAEGDADDWAYFVLQNAPCSVFLASHPVVPKEVVA